MRTPFLCRLLGGGTTEVLEQALIEAGAIQALGFRSAASSERRRGEARLTRNGKLKQQLTMYDTAAAA